jgi:hypothetical protein
MKEDDLDKIKKRLKLYKEEEIEFNEPHFTERLVLREGNRKDVINHLLNPESLVYSYSEKGRYGNVVHCLHFKVSNTRTMRLPVIFDRGGKKSLYIITYIMRYRRWQSLVRKGEKHD